LVIIACNVNRKPADARYCSSRFWSITTSVSVSPWPPLKRMNIRFNLRLVNDISWDYNWRRTVSDARCNI
jgi:hypothetical protein